MGVWREEGRGGWQQRSQLASLDKNVYSQYELCSVGLTPLWDCSRLVRLHWRTSCRGSGLGVEVGERGGAGGHTVHLHHIKVKVIMRGGARWMSAPLTVRDQVRGVNNASSLMP